MPVPTTTSIAVPVKKARRSRHTRARATEAESAILTPERRPAGPVVAQPRHRYQIGERLHLANGGRLLSRAGALCQVLACLPYEGHGVLLYRVRSEAEQFERVVPEIDLTRDGTGTS